MVVDKLIVERRIYREFSIVVLSSHDCGFEGLIYLSAWNRRDDCGVREAVGDATWHKKQEHYL